MNDEYFINIINNYKYFKINTIYKKLSEEEIMYVINRYNDTHTFKENLIRIYNHIDERPICPICGNYCNLTNRNMYGKTCGSNYCHRQYIYKEIIHTCKIKYGTDSILSIKEVNQKFRNTWASHSEEKTKEIIKKREKTSLKKYNVTNKAKLVETKEKMIKTNLEKYNCKCSAQGIEQQKKSKQTSFKKYGVEYPAQSKLIKSKIYNTKTKNKTHNTSIPENQTYKLIKEKYNDVIYHYKSIKYPFNCDFYIPSLDLYIECNYHWTHGGHQYQNNIEDNKIVKLWKSKNTKYYDAAINIWTIRDPRKRNTAKENNLNFIEFWNINEVKNWINKQT